MRRTRVKHSIAMVGLVLATVAATTALFGAAANAVTPDSGTSNAYGINVKLLGGNLLGPIPSVQLGADGAADGVSSTLPVAVPGLLTANTLNADSNSTNFGQATETINASAGAEGLAGLNGLSLIGVAPPLLNVDAINTQCSSSALGSTASTTVVGLSINGQTINIPGPIAPNTGLTAAQLGPLAGLITLTLNAQDPTLSVNHAGDTSVDVIGLQITLLGALDHGAVINVAHSFCQATGPDIEAPAAVDSITPNFGPKAGGTPVTITGTGFEPTSTVTFGNAGLATDVDVVSPTEITAVSPPDASISSNTPVVVQVSNQFGPGSTTPTAGNTFTYEVAPTIASVSGIVPNQGPVAGGTAVTITGTNFNPGDTTTAVTFTNPGGTSANATDVVVVNSTTITAVTPPSPIPSPGTGPTDVTVSDAGGTSSNTPPVTFTYATFNTVVSSIHPTAGPVAGGTTVTITGSGFELDGSPNVTAVDFGTAAVHRGHRHQQHVHHRGLAGQPAPVAGNRHGRRHGHDAARHESRRGG